MSHRTFLGLGRIVALLARLSPPRHRDLVQGMVAELDSIADPAEQARFAMGAIAALARLVTREYGRSSLASLRLLIAGRHGEGSAPPGGPRMSKLTTRQLLRRHVPPFAVTLATLTFLLLANQALHWAPRLTDRGVSANSVLEVLLLSVPFTMALTVPMAVFLSVAWVFARLGKEGVLAATRVERNGFRRLAVPIVGAAAVIAALTLISNTEILPRANSRLVVVLTGAEAGLTERTMTLGELQDAARNARNTTGEHSAALAAAYEVEIHKRLALPVACIVLALVGAAIVFRFPRGGVALVIGGGVLVFTGYHISLVAGEYLADRQVMSPGIAMWMANALLLGVALALAWSPGRPHTGSGTDTPAMGEPGAA